ncbi:MAG: hypothetical protein J1F23_06235 [Oscillospiraceae bacterium]|nr:hypothetical protein [Oscillospiraceae bacterium]
MTFEAMNKNCLIVELSAEEMEQYDITYDTLDEKNVHTKSFIKKILSHACVLRESTLSNCRKITVEALPVGDGGCFFILTFAASPKGRYRVKCHGENVTLEAKSMDDLLDFVSAAKKKRSTPCECEIYRCDGKYFLTVPDCPKQISVMMREFGIILPEAYERFSVFREHGRFMGTVAI